MEINERKTVRKKLEADNEKLKTKLKGLTDEIAKLLRVKVSLRLIRFLWR